MWHPIDSLPVRWSVILFLAFVVAQTLVFLNLRSFDAQIRGENNERLGIVAFELAGSTEPAQDIVDSWTDANVLDTARLSLYLDFAFILCYSVVFSYLWTLVARAFGCLRAGLEDENSHGASRIALTFLVGAMLLGLGQWVGGLLDVIENGALLYILEQGVSAPWPQIAATATYSKFFLVMVASELLFVLSLVAMPLLFARWCWLKRNRTSSQDDFSI